MSKGLHVDFEHPENAAVLSYLSSLSPEIPRLDADRNPDSFSVSYGELGTQPDVISRLWDHVASELPVDCRWVVYLRPILVHPKSGIVFGFASGTPTYAIKLPQQECEKSLAEGYKTTWTYNDAWIRGEGPEYNTVLDLALWGKGWVFGKWQQNESSLGVAAYQFASGV